MKFIFYDYIAIVVGVLIAISLVVTGIYPGTGQTQNTGDSIHRGSGR